MRNIILTWIGMIVFMFFGISFIKLEINPFLWNENARLTFFLFTIFSLVFSFITNELVGIGKKKND